MKTMPMALAAAFFAATITAAHAQSGGPNDAQIAAIVVTANQVDIDAGKLAASKAKHKDVKAFGKREMPAADWARGVRPESGTVLGGS